jgi:hypothetical protein
MNLTLYAGNIYKTIFRFLRHMEVWRPTRGKNCHLRASLKFEKYFRISVTQVSNVAHGPLVLKIH